MEQHSSMDNEGDNGTDQQTPDLSSIIQEVVDRSGWSQGNAAVFLIEGQGTRTAISYDKDPSKAPKLFIQFNGGSLTEVNLQPTNQPLAIDVTNHNLYNLGAEETALVRCVRDNRSSSSYSNYFNNPQPTTKQLQSSYCSTSGISCTPEVRTDSQNYSDGSGSFDDFQLEINEQGNSTLGMFAHTSTYSDIPSSNAIYELESKFNQQLGDVRKCKNRAYYGRDYGIRSYRGSGC